MTHLTLSTSTEALPERWVEEMLDRMFLTYGKRFVDQWAGTSTDKLIAHWSRELAGYLPQEIRRGLDALESRDWPPTLPEFKKLCRPAIDATVAYYEALEQGQKREMGEAGEWSSPAVYWAWQKIGAFDFKNQSYSQLKTRWEKALADEIEKGAWPAVPEPRLALPEPGKSHLSKEKATQMINELNATGTIKKAEAKVDHKLWARRIIKRAEEGDSKLSPLQINFAREALKA
jgi:hypothetical protein